MFVPPAGPGVPATNAAEAWTSATGSCRQARNYQAALRVSGRAGDQRIPGLRVDTALTSDGNIYMSATASGQSIFLLAGSASQATLWLRREERAVIAAPGAILEALLGVPLSPERLLAVFAGCITSNFEMASSAQHDRLLLVQTPDARVYLEPHDAGWRARAGEVEGFTVELGRKTMALPEKVWIWTASGRTPQARLDVTVTDAEVNGTIPPAVFTPPAGAGRATPMTLEELRESRQRKERGSAPR
jgi:hypothetical protein